jgi:choline dehydrogenase-like flavoprotein
MPAANTNASALMIGEKAADMILSRRPAGDGAKQEGREA